MALIAPGICRHCGCTEQKPCGHCKSVHGECCWTDKTRTVCTGRDCVMREVARRKAVRETTCYCVGRGHRPDCKHARPVKTARRKRRAA